MAFVNIPLQKRFDGIGDISPIGVIQSTVSVGTSIAALAAGGSVLGPVGSIVGVVAGLLSSIFGGGKSAEQMATEGRAALNKVVQDISARGTVAYSSYDPEWLRGQLVWAIRPSIAPDAWNAFMSARDGVDDRIYNLIAPYLPIEEAIAVSNVPASEGDYPEKWVMHRVKEYLATKGINYLESDDIIALIKSGQPAPTLMSFLNQRQQDVATQQQISLIDQELEKYGLSKSSGLLPSATVSPQSGNLMVPPAITESDLKIIEAKIEFTVADSKGDVNGKIAAANKEMSVNGGRWSSGLSSVGEPLTQEMVDYYQQSKTSSLTAGFSDIPVWGWILMGGLGIGILMRTRR